MRQIIKSLCLITGTDHFRQNRFLYVPATNKDRLLALSCMYFPKGFYEHPTQSFYIDADNPKIATLLFWKTHSTCSQKRIKHFVVDLHLFPEA